MFYGLGHRQQELLETLLIHKKEQNFVRNKTLRKGRYQVKFLGQIRRKVASTVFNKIGC